MKKNVSGFTIVELLIVIVVIGILAAITIVAYNGMQQKAKNTSMVASANQAIKLIKSYDALNGGFPYSGSACVTTTCTDFSGATASQNSTLTDNLRSIGTPPATVPTPGNGTYSGIWYNMRAAGATFDGQGASKRVMLLMYWLTGQNQDCGVADVAVQGVGEAWGRSSTKYTANNLGANTTACWIPIIFS